MDTLKFDQPVRRFGVLSVMATVVCDVGMSFGEFVKLESTKDVWDTYVSKPTLHCLSAAEPSRSLLLLPFGHRSVFAVSFLLMFSVATAHHTTARSHVRPPN